MIKGVVRKGVSRTASLGRQAVQGVVALAISADLAAERKAGGGAESTAIGVDIGDADLDGRVVLGGDETVCTPNV